MSWLYSIILAGLMFSNESSLPVQTNYDYTRSNVKNVVRLDETERFEQTYPLSANGKVSVSNVNGSIVVETWDRNEVKLEAVKIAENRDRFSEVEIKIDARQDSFNVETEYDNMRRSDGVRNHDNLRVEFRLTVPRMAVLDEVETVNGSVTITNAANSTKASTVNGEVRATNLRGTANLSTVNGTVEADFDQLQTGSRISLNTVNGQANITIPSDANATLKADTLNGNINNDFGLPVRKGQYVGRNLYGRIGSGDVQIHLNSVNGGLTIKRKNDGKNANPATNLLQQKSDDDFNFDDDAFVDTEKMNKEVVKSVKQAQKEMKNAQKEVLKIKPALDKAAVEAVQQAAENINVQEIKERVKEAQMRQKETMMRIWEANWMGSAPAIEKKSGSFAVKGVPKVTVEANNCAVTVRGWDKPEVQYSVVKIGKKRNQTPLNVQANQNGGDVNIKVVNDDEAPQFFEGKDVRVEVFVPKKSNLKISTNTEIRLENVSGEIELSGENGAINVRDSDGNLRLVAADGRIRVLGFKGEVFAQTADGSINLEGDFQKIDARTADGSIILSLPENTNATLAANREINNEGLNLTKQSENNWRLGKGGAGYHLQTDNGEIFIRSIASMKSY